MVNILGKIRNWSFHIAVLQRMLRKCNKIYKAVQSNCAANQLVFFGVILISVAIMACLSSLPHAVHLNISFIHVHM